MRGLFCCVLFCISTSAQGKIARVLLDNVPAGSTIQGAFRLQCLQKTQKNTLKTVSCKKNGHELAHRNAFIVAKFKSSRFQIHESQGKVVFTISNGKPLYEAFGEAFRLKGDFVWQGRRLKTLDLLVDQHRGEWVIHLPLEEYLQGVLGAEVPASWPLEALKAQAVASRSYFLWKQDLKSRYFDVRSDHWDQVFQLKKKAAPRITKAIKLTRGTYLKSQRTQSVFPAFFHSDCGGDTATEHAVWRKPASENQPVVDRVCQSAKENRWSRHLKGSQIIKALKQDMLLPRGVVLNSVVPRGQAGQRVHTIDLLFNENLVKSLSANEFRRILGFGKIKSTRFAVKKAGSTFTFTGQGYGHGVGMCQWGAKRWAVVGKNYQQILEHYYPTAHLKKTDGRSFPSVAER